MRRVHTNIYLALLFCMGAILLGPHVATLRAGSEPEWFGYNGDSVFVTGSFPEDVKATIGGLPAEIAVWDTDYVAVYARVEDPGDHILTLNTSTGEELRRMALLVLAGAVGPSEDLPLQPPIIHDIRVSGGDRPTAHISGLYFGFGNPGDVSVFINERPAKVVGDPTSYSLSVLIPAEIPPDSSLLYLSVLNNLNGATRARAFRYSEEDFDEATAATAPLACGLIRWQPTRGLMGSRVRLLLDDVPTDFEPEVRFEYDGTSRRVTHCNRVGNRWDFSVPPMDLTRATRIRLRIANCQESAYNPTDFDYMVRPELQGESPLSPPSGPSGTPVEILVKNMTPFQSDLLLSEVLLSSGDGGLWTYRFRPSQICRDNPTCPVNVQVLDETAGLAKVRFNIPRDVHPGKVNISLYYSYVPCGSEARASVSLPPVTFIVTPPGDFSIRITNPSERPPRRVVVRGQRADYTLALRNDTGRTVSLNLGLMAITRRDAGCRLIDGAQSIDCDAAATMDVPPGQKNITVQLNTSSVGRTRATIEFRVRAYSPDIGALLEPPTDLPDGDLGRLPARLIVQPTPGPNLAVKMNDPGPPNYTRVTCQGGTVDYTLEVDNIGTEDLADILLKVVYGPGQTPTECWFVVDGREGGRARDCALSGVRLASGDNPKSVKLFFSTRKTPESRAIPFRVYATASGATGYAPSERPDRYANLITSYPCTPGFEITPAVQSKTIGTGETARFDFQAESFAGFSGDVRLDIQKVEKCDDMERCGRRQLIPRTQWEAWVTLSRTRVTLPPSQSFSLNAAAPFTMSQGRYVISLVAQALSHRREFYANLMVGGPLVYQLPQVADGKAQDWNIRTRFVLTNPGPETAVRIDLTDDLGQPLTVSIPGYGRESSTFSLRLARGGTAILETDGQNPALKTGAAVVTSQGTIGVSAIYSIYDGEGRLKSHAGVLHSGLLSQFAVPVLRSSVTRPVRHTGLALFNPNHQTATLTLSLYDETGASYKTLQVALLPRHHLSRFIHESPLFSQLGPTFKGTLQVSSTLPVSAVALITDDLLMAGIPRAAVRPLDAQRVLYLPQVADGLSGDGRRRINSMFLLNNPQPLTATVTIRLTNGAGGPFNITLNGVRGSTHTVTLPPNGSAFLGSDGMGPWSTGAAVVESSVAINASLVYSLYDTASQGTLSLAGVLDSSPAIRMTLPVDYSEGRSVGLALFNPGDRPAAVTLHLWRADGGHQTSRQMTVEPRHHVDQFLSESPFGLPVSSGFRGSLAITVGDGASVSAVGLNIKDELMATIPVTPGAAPAP